MGISDVCIVLEISLIDERGDFWERFRENGPALCSFFDLPFISAVVSFCVLFESKHCSLWERRSSLVDCVRSVLILSDKWISGGDNMYPFNPTDLTTLS